MKKLRTLLIVASSLFVLAACGNSKTETSSSETKKQTIKESKKETVPSKKVDFPDASSFESALKEGQDTKGKTVTFTVDNIVPDGALGYTVWAGEHLNFISTEVLGWKIGETHTVKVTKVVSSTGSFIITFENI